MSMRSYGIRRYGVVAKFSELNLRAIIKAYVGEEDAAEYETDHDVLELMNCEEMWFDNGADIISRDLLDCDIDGDFIGILTETEFEDIYVRDNGWVLLELPKYPTFFEAVYKDKDDMICQMKEMYGPFILNENFDWEKRLVRLDASIYN